MDHSEKIILAACILVAVFVSTNLMLLPLLRRSKSSRESESWKAFSNLFRFDRTSKDEAMEELARRVEQLKQDKAAQDKKEP